MSLVVNVFVTVSDFAVSHANVPATTPTTSRVSARTSAKPLCHRFSLPPLCLKLCYTISKNPKATVLAGSEECFLFVKLKKMR